MPPTRAEIRAKLLAEQHNVEYTVVETVAVAAIGRQPDGVVRISVKHAERLIVEPKSSNYPIAAAWLKRATAAYQQLGQGAERQRYLDASRNSVNAALPCRHN